MGGGVVMPENGVALDAIAEVTLIQLPRGRTAVVDLGEWYPRVHIVEGANGAIAPRDLEKAGVPGLERGRGRELLLREMVHIREQQSVRACSRRWPESCVVVADLSSIERLPAILGQMTHRGVRCVGVTFRSAGRIAPEVLKEAVKALYAAKVFRVRVSLGDIDIGTGGDRELLVALMRHELWSVVPELRVSWKEAVGGVLEEPVWSEVATEVHLSGYFKEGADVVCGRIAASAVDVTRLEVPESSDERPGALRWLADAFVGEWGALVGKCWPYSMVSRGLQEPRIFSPACVRRRERRVVMNGQGRLTCCPRVEGVERWEAALDGERYWKCAVDGIANGVRGCCAAGRLAHRECDGSPEVGCPDVECETASALLPATLQGLCDSVVESRADGSIGKPDVLTTRSSRNGG